MSPTLDDLAAMGEAVLSALPKTLQVHAPEVVLRVEEFPDEKTCRELGLTSPFNLLGLYRGAPLSKRSVLDVPHGPEMIFLYRSPILNACAESDEDLFSLVRNVLIHEIGHHFGFSDTDMEALER